MHEEQKELFESLFIGVLCIGFLALTALLFWPLGKASMAWSLAKGFYVFGIVLYWTAFVLLIFHRLGRISLDSHPDAYVISSLAVGCTLQVGWSAFAATTVHHFVGNTSVWLAAVLYLAGLISSYIAFGYVSTLYGGQIYKTVNLPLSLISYVLFSLWPRGGRLLFGWFFDLCWSVELKIRAYF